jgi:hypothetical protein
MRAVYSSNTTSFDPSIFPNQDHFGKEIATEFMDRSIVSILALALTQSGKTGSMLGVIKHCLAEPSLAVPMDHIFVITGYSSTEWVEQTQSRFPEELRERVYHRNRLASFVKEVKHLNNVLILMDEVQIAFGDKQSIHNAFMEAGIMAKEQLYARDIKVVQFSATPDGLLYSLKKWKSQKNYKIHEMTPDVGYYGYEHMKSRNRLRQNQKVSFKPGNTDTEAYGRAILLDILSFDTPKHHFIRTGSKETGEQWIELFQRVLEDPFFEAVRSRFSFDSISYTMSGDIDKEELDKVIGTPPEQHQFIFVKEKLKCADTLIKDHIGVMVDRCTSNDSFTMQSFLGRGSGYGVNDIIIYTNLDSIVRYDKIMKNIENSEILLSIPWNSNSTKTTGKKTIPKKVFTDSVAKEAAEPEPDPIIIYKCVTLEEVKAYCIETFGKRGPNKREMNTQGYYETTIRSVTKVFTWEEMEKDHAWGLSSKDKETKGYRVHPCYENTEDPTTLQWWVIHY